ncbi:MAG: hypothetical protein VXU42_02905 [Verrucomicrobiota bacterium]|nr:hypothetical protein [Verrucomicrobiota bacterium]
MPTRLACVPLSRSDVPDVPDNSDDPGDATSPDVPDESDDPDDPESTRGGVGVFQLLRLMRNMQMNIPADAPHGERPCGAAALHTRCTTGLCVEKRFGDR